MSAAQHTFTPPPPIIHLLRLVLAALVPTPVQCRHTMVTNLMSMHRIQVILLVATFFSNIVKINRLFRTCQRSCLSGTIVKYN